MPTDDERVDPTLAEIAEAANGLDEQFGRCLAEVIASYGDEGRDQNKARKISICLTFVKRQGNGTIEISAEVEAKVPAARGSVGFGVLDGDRLELLQVPQHRQEEMFGDAPAPVVAIRGRDDR